MGSWRVGTEASTGTRTAEHSSSNATVLFALCSFSSTLSLSLSLFPSLRVVSANAGRTHPARPGRAHFVGKEGEAHGHCKVPTWHMNT